VPAINDLSAADRERFLRIVQESLAIDRHFQLFLWLQGEFQRVLPHEVFIAMVGDFASGDVAIDIVSPLPRVRTRHCEACGIRELAQELYVRWKRSSFQMMALSGEMASLTPSKCDCPIAPMTAGHGAMLVHGLRDGRSGQDALYLLLHPDPVFGERERRMFAMLLPQIDFACRRIVAIDDDNAVRPPQPGKTFELSARELEILEWVRLGKTNDEIGSILNISAFTVKNHLQRIYRKMDVLNRAQAIGKLEESNRRRPSISHH
jgi:transcriptional regulator EpsA